MNTAKAAAALNTASLALAELAEALIEQSESGERDAGVASAGPAMTPAPADTFGSGRPVEEPPSYEPMSLAGAAQPALEAALSRCPYHDTPWSIRPAGVSKAGKSYNSFYTCDGKEPDGSFCPRKPVKAWADSHPIAA
ncbi:MAG TPA: hypothetical protein VGP44_08120 [Gemmatimonadales bacterium]|nr:hypothetical protein [Gemmatimonadales bacterium]